jgi:hypothetical protein
LSKENPGANCVEGGVGIEVETVPASKKYACNGLEGAQGVKGDKGDKGEKGDPWSAGGTLPPGSTETGSWAFNAADGDTKIMAPISFPIPLKEELFAAHVHYGLGETPECPGNVALPQAEPGELCVYVSFFSEPENATFTRISPTYLLEESGTSTSGAVAQFAYSGPAAGKAFGAGSFAVTGCSTEVGKPFPCP